MMKRFLSWLTLATLAFGNPALAQVDPAARGLAVQARSLAKPWRVPPYIGVVVDKARLNTAVSASNTQAAAVTEYRATSAITNPHVIYYNRYISTALNETDGNAALTAATVIEYPIGQTLSARISGTAAPGGKIDNAMGRVVIPKDARFRVWSFVSGPLVQFVNQGGGAAVGSTISFGAGAQTAPVLGAMVSSPSGTNGLFPIVVDVTTLPAVVIAGGDSHDYGVGDTLDPSGYLGYMERYLAGSVGLINGAAAGDSLGKYMTAGNRSMRLDVMRYGSDIAMMLAGNDISAGTPASQIVTMMATAAAEIPAGKRKFTATEFVKTNTSDACATVANQTVTANESIRAAVNVAKRSGAYFDYYLEAEPWPAAISGTSLVWALAPGGGTYSGDCIHPNRLGYIEIARGMRPVVPAP